MDTRRVRLILTLHGGAHVTKIDHELLDEILAVSEQPSRYLRFTCDTCGKRFACSFLADGVHAWDDTSEHPEPDAAALQFRSI